MGLIRKHIIKTKLKEMEESLKLVRDNLPEELDKFVGLGLTKDGIYKRIEFCIENMLDICATLNSDLGLGIPSSEEDIVENLIKNKIMNPKLGEKVKQMKGFRNILVHRYGKISDEMAFESMTEGLGDFHHFMKEIRKILLKYGKD